MSSLGIDKEFGGSMAQVYDAWLVPLIFEAYAADLAERAAARSPEAVLEIASGTGALTRALASALPSSTITATDLNQKMIDQAANRGVPRPVTWRQADAVALPFPDASFDVVVCQFGVMFFPDKRAAFAEARRVLRPGGHFLFNVWDRIEENEFAHVVTEALAEIFPDDPPRFMARTPHGYHDLDEIRSDLAGAGFDSAPDTTTLTKRSRARSFEHPALAFCQGTPLRTEIEARGGTLTDATAHSATAVAKRFGLGPVEGRMQAHVVAISFDKRRSPGT